MPFVAAHSERYLAQVVGNGHCVAYVRAAADLPHTSLWVCGDPVATTDIPRGTAVATFGTTGKYENRTDGASHCAIFQQQISTGIRVLDQWVGHPVAHRVIRWKDGVGKAADDASCYHVIETALVPDD
jgi:hypothetical protein